MADVQGYTPAEPQVPFEPYRTRCEDAEVAVRPDPTVWGPVSSELGTFDEQGFCVLRNVVPAERIEACRKYLATFTSEEQLKVTDNCRLVTEANSSVLRSVFAVHEDDGSPLAELARSDLITRHVQQILADDVYVHQSRVNLQAPFKGTGFSWHSDFETWHAEDGMPKPRSLSAVIFLDKNAEHNGALMVIPGSHKSFLRCSGRQKNANWEKSLQSQVYGTPSEDHIRQLAEKQGIKHCVGEAGDVLFFDSNLLHASSGNRSPFSRRNLFVAFNSWTNRLQAPFYAEEKRPEHVAHRERITRCDRTP
ncbi:unnamed protein product [Effrenium voratum]|nr:unnamed protein product [Effrenium voratum]|mmetsp:Transcript_125416/g.297792  ORF Transcript_125416/g.297792 Transcript_125416/m.297792 type:complete len:307 (+) Transcript_125416:85-1005(+)